MIALVSGRGRGPPRRSRRRLAAAASATGSTVSAETLGHVPRVGETATLFTHLIVRDDALLLYGFATEEERDLFLLLIGVQGVGPKMALAVLSGGPPRELLAAVAAGDTARLQAVPGIGKRTAERIVVELREKVGATTRSIRSPTSRTDDPRALARDGPDRASASARSRDRQAARRRAR